MAFLTDRTLTTGVSTNDLIHIVITGDTSQNPAGSSYKATLGQVVSLSTSITSFTYNSNTFTIGQSDGLNFSATIDSITGITYYEATTGITTSATTLVSGYSYNGINYLGNVDLTLFSPNSLDGLKIIIKDEGGNAGSYRIRITPSVGTIDGNSYVDMNINYMSLTLVARNNNWWLI
jgi:hypothetical protein